MTFVHSLRLALSGPSGRASAASATAPIETPRYSILSLSEKDNQVLNEFAEIKRQTIERVSQHRIIDDGLQRRRETEMRVSKKDHLIQKQMNCQNEAALSACTTEPSTSDNIGHIVRISSTKRKPPKYEHHQKRDPFDSSGSSDGEKKVRQIDKLGVLNLV
jgi:hypothetical protein